MLDLKIGFIGAGNMAQALATGFIKAGEIAAENLSCSSPSGGTAFKKNVSNKVKAYKENFKIFEENEIVILAVKPQYLDEALLQSQLSTIIKPLIISIIAGKTVEQLSKIFPPNTHIVRIMTNTPIIIQQGISVYSSNNIVESSEIELVSKLFSSVGMCEKVPENLMNSYGGLFGSGPAYVFILIEALADGAVRMGIPRNMAQKFAAQLLFGSSMLVLQSGKHPGELKDMVCSPGGTTIAGVYELEKGSIRATLMSAVEASTKRANELSQQTHI